MTTRTILSAATRENVVGPAREKSRPIQGYRIGTVCLMLMFLSATSGGCAITPRIGLVPGAETFTYPERHDELFIAENLSPGRSWLAEAATAKRNDRLVLPGGWPNTNFVRPTRPAGTAQAIPSRLSLRTTPRKTTATEQQRATAWLKRIDLAIGGIGGLGNQGAPVKIRRSVFHEPIVLTLGGEQPTGHRAGNVPARNQALSSVMAVTRNAP